MDHFGRARRASFAAALGLAACAWSASASAQTPTGAPPVGLQVLVNSPTSVRVTWSKTLNVVQYMVARYRQPNLTTPERQSTWFTGTSWDDPGLTGGQTYVYRLGARYADGKIGAAEKSVALPVIAEAPAPIVGGVGPVAGSIWPDILFQPPPNMAGLRVQRQREGNSTIQMLTPSALPLSALAPPYSPTQYHWADSSLTTMGTYYYALIAEFADGRTGTSAWAKWVPTTPDAQNVSVVKRDSYTAAVGFEAPAGYTASYKLFGTGLPAAGIDATVTEARDPSGRTFFAGKVLIQNLAAGTYSWTLRGVYKPGILSYGVPLSISMP